MYIKDTLTTNYGGFELDAADIGTVSTSRTKIHLPYRGHLPDNMDGGTATLAVNINIGLTVNIVLIVEKGGKERRYIVKATPEETNTMLWPLFFNERGHTRHDSGLDKYNLGFWQSAFLSWKRIVLDAHGFDDILYQLSPAVVTQIVEHIKHSEAETAESLDTIGEGALY